MIYIFVFASSIFFAWLAERSKDKGVIVLCSIISILIPSILGGLRQYTVGVDSTGYGISASYAAMEYNSIIDFLNHGGLEPGCLVLFYCGANFIGGYNGAFFLFQIFTMTFIYIGAYKHRKMASLSFIMLVFFFTFYNRTYNEIRNMLAVSIIFMGINNLENKHYLRFSIYILAATLFHYSAMINFFFILAVHAITTSEKYAKRISLQVIMILSTVIFLMFAVPIMLEIISHVSFLMKYNYIFKEGYGYNPDAMFRFNEMVIEYLGELLMLYLYKNRAVKVLAGRHGEPNYNFYKFSIIFYIAFSVFVRIYERLFLYSEVVNVILVATLPRFVKEKTMHLLVMIAVVIVVIVYWLFRFVFTSMYRTWPYRSILD